MVKTFIDDISVVKNLDSSFSPTLNSFQSNDNFLLATYRCQANTTRLELKVKMLAIAFTWVFELSFLPLGISLEMAFLRVELLHGEQMVLGSTFRTTGWHDAAWTIISALTLLQLPFVKFVIINFPVTELFFRFPLWEVSNIHKSNDPLLTPSFMAVLCAGTRSCRWLGSSFRIFAVSPGNTW